MLNGKENDWTNFSRRFQSYLICCIKVQEKISQTKIGLELGFDQATISRIEQGRQGRDISHTTIYALNKYFPNVCLMDFLNPAFTKKFHSDLIMKHDPSRDQLKNLKARLNRLVEAVIKIHESEVIIKTVA